MDPRLDVVLVDVARVVAEEHEVAARAQAQARRLHAQQALVLLEPTSGVGDERRGSENI